MARLDTVCPHSEGGEIDLSFWTILSRRETKRSLVEEDARWLAVEGR